MKRQIKSTCLGITVLTSLTYFIVRLSLMAVPNIHKTLQDPCDSPEKRMWLGPDVEVLLPLVPAESVSLEHRAHLGVKVVFHPGLNWGREKTSHVKTYNHLSDKDRFWEHFYQWSVMLYVSIEAMCGGYIHFAWSNFRRLSSRITVIYVIIKIYLRIY